MGTHTESRAWRRVLRSTTDGFIALLCVATSAAAATQTVTTTYQYNADGAATAVTTQVDAQPATTTYLTWDNFIPSAATPTTGTVSAADGNLVGVGSTPGVSGLTTQFTYDARDRLTGCSAAGQPAATYAYHPAGLMSSTTLAANDTLQFYYDNGATPRMANTLQSSTGLAASFLGPVRYLSDGTEQVLLQPRKDIAGVYDAAAQTLSPYRYEPYGAAASDSATTSSGLSSDGASYDLASNPFQYAAEYHDPTCSTYYLRARWYLPAQQTFLSRDPGDPLHRYGYTAGNPIGRIDPSGLHGVEAGARQFLESLDANGNGPAGAASRFFLGSAIGIAQILANPSGYWHQLAHDTGGIDIFLAAGVAVELGTSGLGPFPDLPGSSYRVSFLGRHVFDALIGAGQSVASGASKHRFDWAAVGQGLEYTAGGMFEGRELLGIGYKPFSLTAADVSQSATAHFAQNAAATDVLVYRVRGPLFRVGSVAAPQFTSPLLELGHLGFYHESLVGVLLQYDVDASGVIASHDRVEADGIYLQKERRYLHYRRFENGAGVGINAREGAAFVGLYREGADALHGATRRPDGPGDFQTRDALVKYKAANGAFPADPYRLVGNNCQNFAARIRGNLGFR